jgi:subtilisin family serine protease
VIVTLARQLDVSALADGADPGRLVVPRLRNLARATQSGLRGVLAQRRAEGTAEGIVPLWIINVLAVTARPAVIRELAARPEVASVELDATLPGPTAPSDATVAAVAEQNLDVVNAPDLWDVGDAGSGVVVASMDSGVDGAHPDLASRWRGGSNSWYDPYGQHPTMPTDVSGHGSMTMGIMVGGEAGGTAVGVAPDARWIAAKVFNDQGSATLSGIHLAFQWLVDPDGNAATDDAPDVVNGSWTFSSPGGFLTFQPDVQALRAVGILPVFAAGNSGPGAGTSHSPANYPESFAVGATDNGDLVAGDSSRGPDACGGAAVTFPDLAAPGVNVRSTDTSGLYAAGSGTSFSDDRQPAARPRAGRRGRRLDRRLRLPPSAAAPVDAAVAGRRRQRGRPCVPR